MIKDTELLSAIYQKYILPTERPDSATLYTDESVEITIADGVRKINSKPGMGASVDKFRSVAKRQNWPPKIVEGLKQP